MMADQIQRKVQKVLWWKSSRWLAECSGQFRKFFDENLPNGWLIKCSELRPLVSANKLTFLNPLYTYTKKSVLRVVAADYHSLRWLTPSASKISQTNFKTSFWGVEIDTWNQTRNQHKARQLGKNPFHLSISLIHFISLFHFIYQFLKKWYEHFTTFLTPRNHLLCMWFFSHFFSLSKRVKIPPFHHSESSWETLACSWYAQKWII